MASDETMREQAVGWAVRTGDPAFADWDAFTAWLEASPAHARAYDEATAAAAEGADLLRLAGPANDDVPLNSAAPVLPFHRRAWFAGAFAASLVAVMALWLMPGTAADRYRIETAPGQMRSVALGPGTSIALAGGSGVELDRANPRFARMIQGQALFTVRHDAAHPFEVEVGDERLVDIGTVFDVRHDDGALSVAVSEGAVQFDPDGADVRISPGEILQRAKGRRDYTLAKLPPEQVGEWRQGRITFTGATLAQVAQDLTRATGIPYAAAPGGAGATVSGSVLVTPLRRDPGAIGPLLGLNVSGDGKRWVIGSP